MTLVNNISCMSTGKAFKVGDEVENTEARFFIGQINDSQGLCAIDKSKPFSLKDASSPMAKCIQQGNYSSSFYLLSLVGTP